MPLTAPPCQKHVTVTHTETGEQRPATVTTDGLVVDKDGDFNDTNWTVQSVTTPPRKNTPPTP